MNIISNNCCGGFCYKYTNTEYNNPFMFASTRYDHLKYLLTSQIDFGKFTIEETIDPCRKGKCYDIIINNKIRICYVHHVRDDKYVTPTTKGINVYYKYIYRYVVEKYVARCKRMCQNKEPFRFLLCPHPGCGSDNDLCDLALLCQQTNTRYCVVMPSWCPEHPIYQIVPTDKIILSKVQNTGTWVKDTMDIHYEDCIRRLYGDT